MQSSLNGQRFCKMLLEQVSAVDQCWIIINNFKNNYPRCMPNDLGYKYLEPDANQGNLMQKQCLTFQFFPSSELFSGNLRKNFFYPFRCEQVQIFEHRAYLKTNKPSYFKISSNDVKRFHRIILCICNDDRSPTVQQQQKKKHKFYCPWGSGVGSRDATQR